MSHVAISRKCAFRNLQAVRMAAKSLGLVCEERSTYRWWGTEYGGSYGDFRIPAGFKEADLGKNAVLVLAVPPERAQQLTRERGKPPYEIGIVADPLHPGSYLAMYDFFNHGYGMEEFVGPPVNPDYTTGEAEAVTPRLDQHYKLAVDVLAAHQAGDRIYVADKAGNLIEVGPGGLEGPVALQDDGAVVTYTVADEERLLAAL